MMCPNVAIRIGAVLFVIDCRLDDFQNDMARANNLTPGFFEINRDPIPINGLNAAQPPIGLIGMANDGAGC